MIDVERIVEETLALCAIPAPTGDEGARAERVEARLRAIPGLDVWRDEVGNVVARVGSRQPTVGEAAPAVVVTAHLDTVFGPEVALHPERAGDTLRGPGIGDNTVALAALIELARALAPMRLEGGVILAATVGEEGLGNLRGVRGLLRAVPATSLIALEGHGIERLVTRGVGSVRLAVAFAGPGGHSWRDRGSPSAVHALAAALTQVVEQIGTALPACSANAGIFRGGTGVNVIAAQAELQLDLRALAQETLDQAEAMARTVFDAAGASDGMTTTIEVLGRRPAGSIPEDHPLVLAAQGARAAAGLAPAELEEGSTDANAGYEIGVPALSVGLTTGGGVHRPDEYIQIAPIRAGVTAALNLITHLVGVAPV